MLQIIQGIVVGSDAKISIGIEATAGVITQQTAGSPIDLKLMTQET